LQYLEQNGGESIDEDKYLVLDEFDNIHPKLTLYEMLIQQLTDPLTDSNMANDLSIKSKTHPMFMKIYSCKPHKVKPLWERLALGYRYYLKYKIIF
jgi:hypothetical protein